MSKTTESKQSPIREHMLIGVLMGKIDFWTSQYEFSFQFWGDGNNNVFINRDDVEVASFGGENSIRKILERTLAWCEKANPRKKYPFLSDINLPD